MKKIAFLIIMFIFGGLFVNCINAQNLKPKEESKRYKKDTIIAKQNLNNVQRKFLLGFTIGPSLNGALRNDNANGFATNLNFGFQFPHRDYGLLCVLSYQSNSAFYSSGKYSLETIMGGAYVSIPIIGNDKMYIDIRFLFGNAWGIFTESANNNKISGNGQVGSFGLGLRYNINEKYTIIMINEIKAGEISFNGNINGMDYQESSTIGCFNFTIGVGYRF